MVRRVVEFMTACSWLCPPNHCTVQPVPFAQNQAMFPALCAHGISLRGFYNSWLDFLFFNCR
jgi:hypothetical protein